MKCKIVNAGFECGNEYTDLLHFYTGVVVHTYKPKLIFKGYKLDQEIIIELVKDNNKERCISDTIEYLKNNSEESIMKEIIDEIKSNYGISNFDKKIQTDIKTINANFKNLIDKEFEI